MTHHLRGDLEAILGFVEPGSTVLDLGCGDGELIELLTAERSCRAQGIEIDDQAIFQCVARGLPVFHGDIEGGLAELGDKAFDYVVLNQSIQEVRKVDSVIEAALRVGRKVVIGFPNFAHWQVRLQVGLLGRTPVTPGLPHHWYETPNLHFFSLKDFEDYCSRKRVTILDKVFLNGSRRVHFRPNLFARDGVYLIERS